MIRPVERSWLVDGKDCTDGVPIVSWGFSDREDCVSRQSMEIDPLEFTGGLAGEVDNVVFLGELDGRGPSTAGLTSLGVMARIPKKNSQHQLTTGNIKTIPDTDDSSVSSG